MIEVRDLDKKYRIGQEDFYALRGVDLKIDQGEFVSVCGTSGSGKTTLLDILGMLDEATNGTYLFEGRDVSKMKDEARALLRNGKIGFVLQDFALIENQTVLYNVMLPLLFSKTRFKDVKKRAIEALGDVGLADQSRKKANQLSGGQRQRVAIARAIINDPVLLLADEPTGQLDSKTGEQIMDVIEGLNNKGITVVMVTHNREIASRSKRKITLSDGKIIGDTGALND